MNEPEYWCSYCALKRGPRLLCCECAGELGLGTDDQIRQFVSDMNNSAERDEKLTGRSSHRGERDPNDVRLETQNHSLGEGHTNFFGWEAITIRNRDYDE